MYSTRRTLEDGQKKFIKDRIVYNENDFDLLNIERTKFCKIHGSRVDEDPLVFAVPGYIKRYRNP